MKKRVYSLYPVRFSDCDPLGHLNNARYIDYMLNAREDHLIENLGFTYAENAATTGCTWATIQNQIAYLKEIPFNTRVRIESAVIAFDERTLTTEIRIWHETENLVHAVLWCKGIYFNIMERKSEIHSEDLMDIFSKIVDPVDTNFEDRANDLRKNKPIFPL